MKTSSFLVAPDKFKGTLSAREAAEALARGIARVLPKAEVRLLPLSDGGEGFVETLADARDGKLHRVSTIDPLGRKCRAAFAALPDGTAVVGLTEASGLWRVPLSRRNPGTTTTIGTGEVIVEALAKGFGKIVVGLGGSATNDGGIGLAAPLGFRFLDAKGHPIRPDGESLARLARIVPPPRPPRAEFIVASDVTHRLYGPQGAACQFAAQKGADPEQVARLDANLRRLAEIAEKDLGVSAHNRAGAGAAGGCGYGLMTFLGAKRVSGFDLFAKASGLAGAIKESDVVVTGEGSFDRTSLGGKGPSALGDLAKKAGKRARLACGICGLSAAERKGTPFEKIVELVKVAPSPDAARADAARWLEEAGAKLARG